MLFSFSLVFWHRCKCNKSARDETSSEGGSQTGQADRERQRIRPTLKLFLVLLSGKLFAYKVEKIFINLCMASRKILTKSPLKYYCHEVKSGAVALTCIESIFSYVQKSWMVAALVEILELLVRRILKSWKR